MKKLSVDRLGRLMALNLFVVLPSAMLCMLIGMVAESLGFLPIDRHRMSEGFSVVLGMVMTFLCLLPRERMDREWSRRVSDDDRSDCEIKRFEEMERTANIVSGSMVALVGFVSVDFFYPTVNDALRGNVEQGIAPLLFFAFLGGLVAIGMIWIFRAVRETEGNVPDKP